MGLGLLVAANVFAHGSPCKKALEKWLPEAKADKECHDAKVKQHYKKIIGCLEKNKAGDAAKTYEDCKKEVLAADSSGEDHHHDGDEHGSHSTNQNSGSSAVQAQ